MAVCPRFDVRAARSGPEALDLLREGQATDLLLTDLRMPGMDGLELLKAARTISPELEVVATTSSKATLSWEAQAPATLMDAADASVTYVVGYGDAAGADEEGETFITTNTAEPSVTIAT